MRLYILDTNIISLLNEGNEPVSDRVRSTPPELLSTTVISLEESLSGWYTYIRKLKKYDDVVRGYNKLRDTCMKYATFEMLPLTDEDLRRADGLIKLVKNVRKNDLRIASIALNNNATVVTANIRDFQRIPGLNYEDWTLNTEPRS
jgi:tRNA(fMet)-specific endonuclease VapC